MIYGMGSNYEGSTEMMPEFIRAKAICLGWGTEEAAPLHQLFNHIGVGDIVYLKSYPPAHGLYIKAVGVVISSEIFNIPELGVARKVKWLWVARSQAEYVHLGHLQDKYDNIRGGSLYPEYGPKVQNEILLKVGAEANQ
jgi:hypothetical protein